MGTRPQWAADKESSVDKHDGRETAQSRAGDRGGLGDPWYDALASGWGEWDGTGASAPVVPAQSAHRERSTAGVYLEVQRSAAFQQVRGRYRRFVFPACAIFFAWYVAYIVAATSAPTLMARPVAGSVNVAMVAGLGQFASTFLLTWLYVRHARLHRDRAALELRWDTQEMTRGIDASPRVNGSARVNGTATAHGTGHQDGSALSEGGQR
ncbi:DUF485 domain-containing protein [Streptomyces sp. SID14478]|uniref:DUF485 domain-containing protein n=1 Tax=Streptomyces sp. SID14478 TaxID=2706073 RepID=UPI0013E01541|nr:DUF485 domain-containing protein [Streptomyces sp. SID14478]NEB80257.1 DUF485 domain-containing protein [Streptomyces sp. SID14478]